MYVELTKVSEIYSYDNQQCNFQGMHFLLGLNPMCPSNYYPCIQKKTLQEKQEYAYNCRDYTQPRIHTSPKYMHPIIIINPLFGISRPDDGPTQSYGQKHHKITQSLHTKDSNNIPPMFKKEPVRLTPLLGTQVGRYCRCLTNSCKDESMCKVAQSLLQPHQNQRLRLSMLPTSGGCSSKAC